MRRQRLFLMGRVSVSAGLAALTVLSFAGVGWADDVPSSGAHAGDERGNVSLADQGVALYKAREYRRAAEKFLQAYAVDQDPNLLFNVARCYESLGDKAGAIEKYEAYLRAPNTDPNGRERAEAGLRLLREAKTPREAQATGQAGDKASKSTPTAAPPASHGDSKPVVGWIVTAALAAGTAVTGILAMNSSGELKDARAVFPGDSARIDSLASKTLTLSVVADVMGAASMVMGGLSLYWTMTSSSSTSEIKAGIGPGAIRVVGTF